MILRCNFFQRALEIAIFPRNRNNLLAVESFASQTQVCIWFIPLEMPQFMQKN